MTQSVGPFENGNNITVVQLTSGQNEETLIDKDHDVVLLVPSDGRVNFFTVELPASPEAGETHRFVNTDLVCNVGIDGGTNPTTINPQGTGVVGPFTGIVANVPPATIVDFTWSETASGWMATCCASIIPD